MPAPKRTPKPAPKPERPADVEDALNKTRKEYETRARNELRSQVLPHLESVILAVRSGPIRNKLTSANILLLQVLDELAG